MIEDETIHALLCLLALLTLSLEFIIMGICLFLKIPSNLSISLSVGIPSIFVISFSIILFWWCTRR